MVNFRHFFITNVGELKRVKKIILKWIYHLLRVFWDFFVAIFVSENEDKFCIRRNNASADNAGYAKWLENKQVLLWRYLLY